MEYKEIIGAKDDLLKNIETIESYLNPYGDKDKIEYVKNLIKNEIYYIAYKVGEEIRFAPSEFVSYAENSMEKNENNDIKDGRRTIIALEGVLGATPMEDAEMEDAYLKYCSKLFITPRTNDIFGVRRKYWRMF